MITRLHGILLTKSVAEAIIDVGGIGYSLTISLPCYEQLPAAGSEVTISTYLHVREDALVLFGFVSEGEKQMFLNLISISGIGPKMAMNILSGRSAEEIRTLVVQGNIQALVTIPGIGRKTAERIVVELRDKLAKGPLSDAFMGDTGPLDLKSEALTALISLGYSRTQSEQAIRRALQSSPNEPEKVEDLIRAALKFGFSS